MLADKTYDADWLHRQIETAGDVLDIPPMALTDAGNLASTRCFYRALRVKSARAGSTAPSISRFSDIAIRRQTALSRADWLTDNPRTAQDN